MEEITNNSNKYCIFGLMKVSPNIQYLLELFAICSNNQIIYKLPFILFIKYDLFHQQIHQFLLYM